MKTRKALLGILILMLLIVFGSYFTRNQWVGYALKKEISIQSHGNINISFSGVYIDVFKKRLTISHPSVKFKNIFLNKNHTLELKGSDFKELDVYNLSLWDLVIRHEFLCQELIVVQPSFHLASVGTSPKNISSGFDPSALASMIQNHRIIKLPIKFLIKHTYIRLGKLELTKTKKSGEFGGVEYNISIDDLGTLNENTKFKEVSFGQLKVKAHNLFRYSTRRNFSLRIDSIFYLSSPQELIINGLHFNSLQKVSQQKAHLNFNIKWVKLNGFSIDTLPNKNKSIHINILKWAGGEITLPPKNATQISKPDKSVQYLHELLKTYPLISFDTLSGKHVHIYQLAENMDTTLTISRFNIDLLNTKISWEILKNPFLLLPYKSLSTSFSKLHVINIGKGYEIHADKVNYVSEKQLLSIKQILVGKFCPKNRKPEWRFSSPRLQVHNFSGNKFRKKFHQTLSTELSSPHVQLWESSFCRQTKKIKIPDIFKWLGFKKLNIKHGVFQFYGRHQERFRLSGFDLNIDNLKENFEAKKPSFSYSTLFFKAKESRLLNPANHLEISTGSVKWQARKFSLRTFSYVQAYGANSRNIMVPSITLVNLRLSPLLFEGKLIGSAVYFNRPEISIRQKGSLRNNADIALLNQNHVRTFPLKVLFSHANIKNGHIKLIVIQPMDSIKINTGVELSLNRLKLGYEKTQLLSMPRRWEISLHKTSISSPYFNGNIESLFANSSDGLLSLKKIFLFNNNSSALQFKINIPNAKVSAIDYTKLFRSDSLVFRKVIFQKSQFKLIIPPKSGNQLGLFSQKYRWTVLFDSLEVNHSGFTLVKRFKFSNLKVTGLQLNLLYKPLFESFPIDSTTKKNLIKKWNVSLQRLNLSDTINNIQIVADGIKLQSKANQLSIRTITGSNIPGEMAMKGMEKDYTYFKLFNMKFSGLQLGSQNPGKLRISRWTTPLAWVNIIHENSGADMQPSVGMSLSLFKKSTGFLNSIHIDSTLFNKVNFSFLYNNRKKLINILDMSLTINDINIDSTFGGSKPNYLFKEMLLNSHGKTIISSDSMYAFRTKDIRINLPLKRISLDSLTITPRYKKQEFFKKAVYQTDRITLYGKSVDFNNFDLSALLNKKLFQVGNISLNHFNVLFERDKHYPESKLVKPMPLELLREIPYKFMADSVLVNNSLISYYEYQKKTVHPGIFFINNFNLYMFNVTNDYAGLNSSAVLKIHGNGQLMRQANLNFVLVMPYFAADNRFWFSAQTNRTDLSQFNSLMQNIVGISIASGTGEADVQYVSGNDKFAKGNMLFLYKNLKLRLYNRKKAKTKKGLGSPFVNFMMNNLMIRSNNPKFLKPPRKGIVYFVRNPHKSFINYLWKSSLSGILSTIGFNNKQQRIEKKVEKKESKLNEKKSK